MTVYEIVAVVKSNELLDYSLAVFYEGACASQGPFAQRTRVRDASLVVS
jgi:hypothetical protein